MNIVLSDDQKLAIQKIKKWHKSEERFFILQGFAGTGKSFLIKKLAESNISNLFFSATTNKACKVLEKNLERQVKTIYSLLGLKMEEKEDKLVLSYAGKPPYFPRNSIIVIDEASMVGQDLLKIILTTKTDLRFIFVGDPAQLPPVGEKSSLVWKITDNEDSKVILRQVMRNDNELLNLATNIRACLRNKDYDINIIKQDISYNEEGVYVYNSYQDFENILLENIKEKDFTETKVIAWTNDRVNYYNNLIRRNLGYKNEYEIGEIILIAKPVERDEIFLAHKDDEFCIKDITDDNYVEIDGEIVEFYEFFLKSANNIILKIPKNKEILSKILYKRANKAQKTTGTLRSKEWKEFWQIKNYFDEVRYGYALTAHRAQGSTLTECFIDQMDILKNYKSQEAFQCLYVAVTRATKKIHTF